MPFSQRKGKGNRLVLFVFGDEKDVDIDMNIEIPGSKRNRT